MKSQLKRIGLVVSLAVMAGMAFLAGQLSTPSLVSAQSSQCVVAATHTGQWKEDQIIWTDANRLAVATVTNTSGASASLYADGRYRTVSGGSGATVIGSEISTATAGGAGGIYMITTTVPCP